MSSTRPWHLGGAVGHAHARACLQRLRRAGRPQVREPGVEAVGGLHRAGLRKQHAGAHLPGVHARQVEGHAVAGLGALDRLAVDLCGAHARPRAAGQHLQLVARCHLPAPERPRDHGARALDGERAV